MDLITCQYCIWYSQWIKLLNKEFFDANSKSRVVDKLKVKEKTKVCERNVFINKCIFSMTKKVQIVIQKETEIENASLLDQLIRYY